MVVVVSAVPVEAAGPRVEAAGFRVEGKVGVGWGNPVLVLATVASVAGGPVLVRLVELRPPVVPAEPVVPAGLVVSSVASGTEMMI